MTMSVEKRSKSDLRTPRVLQKGSHHGKGFQGWLRGSLEEQYPLSLSLKAGCPLPAVESSSGPISRLGFLIYKIGLPFASQGCYHQ